MSPEALTTRADFFVDDTLPRLRGDFDFIIITPGVMDADFNEKLIVSYFILYLKRNA